MSAFYLFLVCTLVSLLCGTVDAFYVTGNRLYNSTSNSPILLRGMARPSLEWNTQGQYMSLSDYTLMKSWGANVVRLSLNQCFWLTSSTATAYIATVDQQVQWIKSLGMAVILDLHWSVPGSLSGCAQQNMADSNSITFWTQVAGKYKNDPEILFELYNEPHDVSWPVWLNGDGSTYVGFQTLYNTVRNAGANNVVIVGGLIFAYDLSGVGSYPLNGTNIMYNSHPYANDPRKDVSQFYTYFGYLASKYPLILTEFGDYTCDPVYEQSVIDYCNQNAISYTAWAWWDESDNICGFPSLISDWSGTPTATGNVVKNDLLSSSKIPGVATAATISTITSATASTTGSTTGSGSTTAGGDGINEQVYTDSVVNFADWSWAATRNPTDSSQQHSGCCSYSYAPSNNYDAIYFYKAGGITTTEYAGVEFWVNGGSAGGQTVNFDLVQYDGSNSNKIGPDSRVATYTSTGTIPANTWVRGYVAFSSFPAGTYDGFWFQSQASSQQSTMYIDDVTLIANTPATTTSSSATTSTSSTSSAASSSTSTQATTSSTSSSSSGTTASSTKSASSSTASSGTTASSSSGSATTSAGSNSTTSSNSTTTSASCPIGSESCPCTKEGNACDAPLTCLSGLCVNTGDNLLSSSASVTSLSVIALVCVVCAAALRFL